MTAVVEQPTHSSQHEVWSRNERMRHVPSADWIVWKLDIELRHRIELMQASFGALPFDHARHGEIEQELRSLCRSIDRLGEAAKHTRNNGHPPADLMLRVGWTINHAVTSLNTLDPTLFG